MSLRENTEPGGHATGGATALEIFAELMIQHGTLEHVYSDNGPEMVAKKPREGRLD